MKGYFTMSKKKKKININPGEIKNSTDTKKETLSNTSDAINEASNDSSNTKKEVSSDSSNTKREISSDSSDAKNEASNDSSDAKKEVQEVFPSENALELHSMQRKERRKIKKQQYLETTKDMTKLQKLSYFFTYYKWYVIAPIVVILLLLYLGVTIYNNSLPVELSYVILNAKDPNQVNLDFVGKYEDYHKITCKHKIDKNVNCKVTYSYFKEHEESIVTRTDTDYSILSMKGGEGYYDVIIGDMDGLKYCSTSQIISPLQTYFGSDTYQVLEDKMVKLDNYFGEKTPFALDISDTEFARNLNLGYDEVYLAFPGTTEQNRTNAYRMIEYIYNIKLNAN